MNKEENIDYINSIHDSYIKELQKQDEYIKQLQQENKQLKDNWNKLKQIVKSQSDFKLKVRNKELWFEVDELLSKMQELEKSDSNEQGRI